MFRQFTIKELLQVENSSDVLGFVCPDTNIPMWSVIRVPLHRLILGDMLYGVPLLGGWNADAQPSQINLKVVSSISKSFIHNAFRFQSLDQQYPVLLMATGARLVKLEEGSFNNLSDHFISAAPDRTFAIEDMFDWKWPFPRQHSNVLIHTPIRIEGVLRGQLRAGNFREAARALVDLACARAKNEFDWEVREDRKRWLEKFCANRAASLLPRYRAYLSIFKKIGVRLLIKEEACYGGADNAAAILAARHSDMVVAEYQHGAISRGHNAYNFADSVLNNHNYMQTLPDHFLAYGSWWSEQINLPINKISIGNPQRAEVLNVQSVGLDQCRKILILGEGHETALYLEFCERLATALGSSFEVVFRPHQLERARVLAKHSGGLIRKVLIDNNQDIYNSIREASILVAEVSTGMFEAVGVVPRIFIYDTPKSRFAFPTLPFPSFSDVDDLVNKIHDEGFGLVSTQKIMSIWAPNWKRNYLDFIEQAVRQ